MILLSRDIGISPKTSRIRFLGQELTSSWAMFLRLLVPARIVRVLRLHRTLHCHSQTPIGRRARSQTTLTTGTKQFLRSTAFSSTRAPLHTYSQEVQM